MHDQDVTLPLGLPLSEALLLYAHASLKACGGCRVRAAAQLGLSIWTFRRLMARWAELGLSIPPSPYGRKRLEDWEVEPFCARIDANANADADVDADQGPAAA